MQSQAIEPVVRVGCRSCRRLLATFSLDQVPTGKPLRVVVCRHCEVVSEDRFFEVERPMFISRSVSWNQLAPMIARAKQTGKSAKFYI